MDIVIHSVYIFYEQFVEQDGLQFLSGFGYPQDTACLFSRTGTTVP
jgi:hypothetical protein